MNEDEESLGCRFPVHIPLHALAEGCCGRNTRRLHWDQTKGATLRLLAGLQVMIILIIYELDSYFLD